MTERSSLDTFEAERTRLFGLAYRMTGSVAEAEDVVQDAWLRFDHAAGGAAQSPAALLTTIVTRLCIDHLRSARAQREQYIGTWLPEPLHTRAARPEEDPEQSVLGREALDYAFLHLLERLSPVERAVVVLHDAFEMPHREIAGAVGCSEAASRQHLRRARQKLEGERSPRTVDRAALTQVVESFLTALRGGDVDGVVRLLADDAVWVADGGGKAAAAVQPVVGRERIARLLFGLAEKVPHFEAQLVEANGTPAVAIYIGGRLDMVGFVEVRDGAIALTQWVRNPDKLVRFAEEVPVG